MRNIAPVANAGSDSIGQISSDIVLDGRSSSDSNGDPLTYRWIQLQGPILSSLEKNLVLRMRIVLEQPSVPIVQENMFSNWW